MTKNVVPLPSVIPHERRDLYTIYDGIVYRFDGRNGQVIWQTPVSTPVPINNQSNSALLHVVSGVVYAVLTFDIYALGAGNGEQIWHVINHTKKGSFWAVVDNGRVYLYSHDDTFSALNAADGSVLWHNTTFTTRDGYGFSVCNGHVYTQLHTNGGREVELFTLDGATGKVRWSIPLPSGRMTPPLVKEGVIYIARGNFLFALKEQSGESIWEQEIPHTSLSNPYLANGILYAESSFREGLGSRLYRSLFHIVALNAQTGQPLWIVGPNYCRLTGECLPTGADFHHLRLPMIGGLLLADNGGRVVGLDAQTGRVAQSYPIQSTTWGAILDDTLYLVESVDLPQEPGAFTAKRAFTLKSLNPGTGDLLSSHPLETEENTFHVDGTGNGLLYQRIFGPQTGLYHSRKYRFVAYHLSDGSLAWSYTMPPLPPQTSSHREPRSAPVLAP